jgi:hypothetical protein
MPYCLFLWWYYIVQIGKGYSVGMYHHFQQYFRYIVTVSFIGVENMGTRRKSPTNIITYTSPPAGLINIDIVQSECLWSRD